MTEFNRELKELADDMIETMYAEEGIGLAAQQIDRAISLRRGRAPRKAWRCPSLHPRPEATTLDLIMPMALVNPKVSIIDPSEDVYEEGCSRFPTCAVKSVAPSVCAANSRPRRQSPRNRMRRFAGALYPPRGRPSTASSSSTTWSGATCKTKRASRSSSAPAATF